MLDVVVGGLVHLTMRCALHVSFGLVVGGDELRVVERCLALIESIGLL